MKKTLAILIICIIIIPLSLPYAAAAAEAYPVTGAAGFPEASGAYGGEDAAGSSGASGTDSGEPAVSDYPQFVGKTWDEIVGEYLEKNNLTGKRVTLGYYNTVTSEEHYYNPDEYMVAASLYKLPLNMVISERIAKGEMSWDDLLMGVDYERVMLWTLRDSSNEWAEYEYKYTLKGWGNYRLTIAPYMGVENPEGTLFMNQHFTARQMIFCLKTLYEGGEERFPKVIEFLLQAEPEKYFNYHPQAFPIAHKYGYVNEDGGLYLNDSAICYTDDPICIVMFTFNMDKGMNDYLADYCTLMCDYAQYTRAVRLEAEEAARLAEEAEAAAKAAEEAEAAARAAEEAEAARAAEEAARAVAEEAAETSADNEETGSVSTEQGSIIRSVIFIGLGAMVFILTVMFIVQKRRR